MTFVIIVEHTLEHQYNIRETLENFKIHSQSNSKLIIFVPNADYAGLKHFGPRLLIGESHTAAFTMDWFLKNLPRHCFSPCFYTIKGDFLPEGCSSDEPEIALVATRFRD